ncbi:MAG TPA: CdaR family protein [Anaerolineae bacterium]|nr:CdaR family protein [Anaerolineae bacterium]
MSNVLRQLLNNLSSIILALLLAVAVWVAATLQADPFGVREFAAIAVTPVNQPENTVLFEGDAARVSVEARAPQSVLVELSVSDFAATMDLLAVPPGVTTAVPISVTSSSEAVRIQAYAPQQQTVRLESLRTMTLPVETTTVGQVATGYLSTRPVVLPREVAVHGPEPFIAQVASVVATIDLGGAREDIVENVSVVPRDATGKLVAGVQWSPEQVQVRVGVRKRVGYKPDVEVVPDVLGDPAPGYRRGSVTVSPSTVTLAGPPQVLDEMPGFVRTLPISITGATADITERSPLTMPASLVVVGVNYVTVTVEILPILSSRTMTSVVGIQGLSQGWVATLSPNEVDVILEGPDTLLAETTSEDLQVFVNLFGLGLGVHRVEPIVLYPDGITVVSVIPETIEVVIALPPTPPPPPDVSPTSTVTITVTPTGSSP